MTAPQMVFNRITLAFPKSEEKAFMEKYYHESITQVRFTLLVSIFLYAIFGFLDPMVSPSLMYIFHIIRFVIVIPVLSIVILFSYTKIFIKIWQALLLISFMVGGLGILIMLILLKSDSLIYLCGLLLVLMGGYTFIKLRFLLASISGWLLVILFNLATIYVGFPRLILISSNFFFIGANVIGMFASYNIEYYSRRDFFLNQKLAAEKQHVEEINQNLEQTIEDRTSELVKAKDKAEESDRLKTAFLQNMSHEIRTPMNAIMGFANLLPEYFEDKENLQKFATIINQRGNDLLAIINDILDIAKIESGQSSIHMEECNLNELFSELGVLFKDYQKRLNKPHIKISLLHSNHAELIITDRGRLKQILINLISNALKFTEQGSIECGYRLNGNNQLQFYVSDTGVGIPKEKHNFVFERFAQLSHTSQQMGGGTGLGLPIVKGLVGLLGGEVWLESEYGKGTTFFFTISYNKTHSAPTIQPQSTKNQNVNFSGKSLLIVEDDNYNALYLNNILNNTGLNISTVKCGHDAVKFAQEHTVDMVLMDIRLPDITGYEATHQILQSNPNVKIITQTAYAASDERQKALDAGCVDYISKPIKKENLLALLKKYLG